MRGEESGYALRTPPASHLDLPVRPDDPALGSRLFELAIRHSQIGPAYATAHCDELPVSVEVLALHAERYASRSAPAPQSPEPGGHLLEELLTRDHELEHSELLARPPLDERNGVTEREAHETIFL